jgi:hypothetical protein
MKKKIAVLMVVLVAMLAFSSFAMAAPTEVNIDWNGAGQIGSSINTGDSSTVWSTAGNFISGSFVAKDKNDNPYNYGVDSNEYVINASVSGGGYIEMQTDRLTSKESTYGTPGQQSYAFVGANDGDIALVNRTTTNYAAMKDPCYQYQLSGGHNITVANSSAYEITRFIADGKGNTGNIYAFGDGDAVLDSMSSEMGGTGIKLGHGCGCYTDANYTASGGSGHFEVTGVGNNSVVFEGLGLSSGGGSLSIVANWANNFSIDNYAVTAK